MNYCSECGHKVVFGSLPDEHLPRFHCLNCGTIHYQNPRVIVGVLPIWEDKVMLCRRGIEPQLGLWNLPGGFMENDETAMDGAAREMLEETGGKVRILGLHTAYTVVPVNQVHLHFLAEMVDLDYHTTPESTEIRLFTEGEIVWKDIAFASNYFALKRYFEDQKRGGIRQTHLGSLTQKEGRWSVQ